MKVAIIAVGQAGGKIADDFIERETETGGNSIVDVVAVNTAKADLLGLEHIPKDRQVLIGQSRVKGHGVGADNELGAKIMEEDIGEVQAKIDEIPTTEVEAFLVIAALGGGTGSGGAPVIAKHLRRIYEEPVYGVGILPSTEEGGIYNLNAARSFKTVVDNVDNLIVFDNETWRQSGASVESGYEQMNDELVKRLSLLFNAGEVENEEYIGESVVDSSEIINTLGNGGISTIGYAVEELNIEKKGLLDRFRKTDNGLTEAESTNTITSLTRKAALGRLTLNCDISSVERALLVISGPPSQINRKGVERSRKWIEEETGSMEVRGGDYPIDTDDAIAAITLFSGVTDAERIKELQQIAIEAQDNLEEIRDQSEENLEELIDTGDDELDSLF